MALDAHTKDRLLSVFRTPEDRDLVVAAIDSNGSGPAATVAAIPASTNIPASAAVLSTSNTYTDAAVITSINAAVNGVTAVAETRLDTLESKVNAVIAALKAAGMMS